MDNAHILVIVLVLVALWIYYQSQKPQVVSKGTQTEERKKEYQSTEENPVLKKFFEDLTGEKMKRTDENREVGGWVSKWFNSVGEETINEYFERKYPNNSLTEWIDVWKNWKKYTFGDKELIWDFFLYSYGVDNVGEAKFCFPLVNVDDLTDLVKKVNENNWNDLEFVKSFGFSKERDLRGLEESKVYTLFDNLANQILVRCIIVTNRLTYGVDKESEENLMNLGLAFQECNLIPEPKIFSKFSKDIARQRLRFLINQALSGEKVLLSCLQDLPYLNPKYRLKVQ